MKYLLMILCSFVLAGCNKATGAPIAKGKNKNIECTDTRDGEVFTYRTDSIFDKELRWGKSVLIKFSVVDGDGNIREVRKKDIESFLKCKEISNPVNPDN